MTNTVRTAVISRGLILIHCDITRKKLPVAVCLNRELPKDIPTAKISARATRLATVTAVLTVDGVGHLTTWTYMPLQRPCAVASLKMFQLTLEASAKTPIMAFAVQTAQAATGLGRRAIHLSGNQTIQAADAQPHRLKRRSLGVIVALLPMVSVAPTAVSAVGPGSPTILKNGPETAQHADARTGGVTENHTENLVRIQSII